MATKLTQQDIDNKRLHSLKFISYDNYTDDDIQFLEQQGIINWVWPRSYWKLFRIICTLLFHFLEYKRHDVNFWKGWNMKDFEEANWWILKYSFKSLAYNYRTICTRWWRMCYLIPLYVVFILPKVLVIMWAYNSCSTLWKKAFNFYE